MDAIALIRRLLVHAAWADDTLLAALREVPNAPAAWREFSHVLGADETWLARLEGRPSRTAVWPTLTLAEAEALRAEIVSGYEAFVARLTPERLAESVRYTNSAGATFETAIGEILLHVALHAQYHRGKINLLLRQGECSPAPTDFIAFSRGVAAAVTRPA